jgi:site-specific recombinase XerD
MDITAAIDEYLACRKNALTHDSYRWYSGMLNAFEAWCHANGIGDLSKITAVHVQQFVAANPQLSDNTKHHRAQVIKGFLRWCAEDEDFGVRAKVVARIEMPVVEQPDIAIYSRKELQALLAGCEKTKFPLRWKAVLFLLWDTGIRLAELGVDLDRPEENTGLLREHVIFGKRGQTESYIIVMGKGRKPRTIKFGDETHLALQRYINRERARIDSPYLFLKRGKEPLTTSAIEDFLTRLGEATGIPNVHAHRFRHTFAIHQLLAGTSSLVLMELMGHTTLEATKIYTRALSQMQAREASVSVVDEWRKLPREQRNRQ